MTEEIRIAFDAGSCILCHACEVACHSWRDPDSAVRRRRMCAAERGRFPDAALRFRSLACLHCADPACAAACPAGAIRRTETGAVVVDREACVGCRACAGACPFGVPQFDADGTMVKCDLCAAVEPEEMKYPCVRMCPTGALRLTGSGEEKFTQF